MNLLYFAIDANSSTSGITKKIKDQACALGSLSESLSLLLASASSGISRYRYDKKRNTLELIETLPPLPTVSSGVRRRYEAYRYYSDNIPRFFNKLCKEENISSVYCRRISMMPSIIQMFKNAKKRYCLDIGYEIPTYPYFTETIKGGNLLDILLELIFPRFMYKLVDHFFLITDTANEKYVPFKNWTRITNGINVDRIRLRSAPRSFSEGLHLLGLANTAFWHGYDRVIKGIYEYNKVHGEKPLVFFHIAGEGAATASLKKMTQDLGIEEHVIFHGSVFGDELDDLFDQYHIGVGSLGAHRKHLSETSELKIREYCARGIPFFLSIKDPDFQEGLDFIHYVPSDDSPIDIKTIVSFSCILEQDSSIAEKMRDYASSHLDWKKTMENVYIVFESLAKNNTSV